MNVHLIILLALASLRGGMAQVKPQAQKAIPNISYCELLREPKLYEGQLVRVSATWTYGFEWSYLYHRECPVRERAGVDSVKEDELCEHTNKVLKELTDDFDNKADVVVVGTLRGGGGRGRRYGYKYHFVVTCLEQAKQIPATEP